MPTVYINYLAVIAATVLSIVLGFLWYGPVFGKKWIALMKFSEADMKKAKEAGMGKNYALMAISSFVMAYVLAHSVAYGSAFYEISGASAGAMAGFWSWFGFIAPVTLSSVLWEGKSWSLWVLNNGYYVVSLVLMGILLSVWV